MGRIEDAIRAMELAAQELDEQSRRTGLGYRGLLADHLREDVKSLRLVAEVQEEMTV